ncbi:MAG: DUF1918 domain-containing protein, partial [Pseudonocardiaceae bacterium]
MGEKEQHEASAEARRHLTSRPTESGKHEDLVQRRLGVAFYREVHGRDQQPSQADPGGTMHAVPGERIIVRRSHLGEPASDGEIIEVRGPDGSPPFLVRWSDTGNEALVFPGSDAEIHHCG